MMKRPEFSALTQKIRLLVALGFFHFSAALAQVDVVYNDLVWSDEFDYQGPVNSNKWFHQTQLPAGGSWYNNEVQHYTNRIENSFVSGTDLNILARRENFTDQNVTKQFTSARLNSKFAFKYGRVDIRAKAPNGSGTWPALWLLGKNVSENGGFFNSQFGTTPWPACGEIDIMEHGIFPSQPINYIGSAIHTPSSFGNTINKGGIQATDIQQNYHVYSMNWSPFQITFLLDGVAFYTYNPAIKDASTWPFDKEQYLLLNIAMGGYAGTIPANFSQTSMIVDYVRVYQNISPDTLSPTNFTATVGTISGSTIELKLNAQDNSGIIKYVIQYGTNSDTVFGNSGIQKSAIISNLTPETNYTFSVSAFDLAGNGAVNNPIVLNATTLLTLECEGTDTEASQGSFTEGYRYKFETFGTDVKITFELLDDKSGLVAYLWRQSPFSEVQMTNVSGRIFTHTITGQTIGATINYAVKFAYTGGMSVTKYVSYVVGNNCLTPILEKEENPISCFPVPSNGRINIEGLSHGHFYYQIKDLLGKEVKQGNVNPDQPMIDLFDLENGIYFLNSLENGKPFFTRIILQK